MRIVLSALLCWVAVFCWSIQPGAASAQSPQFLSVPRDPRGAQPAVPTADHWSFVPIAGAKCRNDSDTGLGARLVAGSRTLVITLQAGGACFSGLSCGVNLNKYSATDFVNAAQSGGFDRGIWDSNGSGLAADSHVFIPYCTGDLFAGGGVAQVDGVGLQNFAGYANMGLFFDYIVDTLLPLLGSVREVKFVGLSAGGFGALLNTPRLRDRLPVGVKLGLLQDSAPALDNELFLPCHQQRLHDQWRFAETIRPVCGARCSATNRTSITSSIPPAPATAASARSRATSVRSPACSRRPRRRACPACLRPRARPTSPTWSSSRTASSS